jgi:hypothetical protein
MTAAPANALLPAAGVNSADAYKSTVGTISDWIAKQRADAAARGLWDDASGMPTQAGIIDAMQQYGGALVAGTAAPGGPAAAAVEGVGGAPVNSMMPPIRAYHGSPHDFDRFDTSKIGTGEGAQAYGHGLYFAENEGVARGYRDALTSGLPRNSYYQVGDKTFGRDMSALADHTDPRAVAAYLLHNKGGDYQGTIADVEHTLEYSRQMAAQTNDYSDVPNWERTLAALKEFNGQPVTLRQDTPGHMYEVNINANPDHFLDWDKPLSEQSQHVQDILTSRPEVHQMMQSQAKLLGDKALNPSGQSMYAAITGWKRGVDLSPPPGAAALAAQRLRDAGIPGIRYLDQGSRASGEGTHNHVVFDPATIEILRKYGLAGLMAGGGVAGGQSQ